jgi:phosphohistidine phosphatase
MDARNLALMRHAKSSWDDPAQADHERPLNPRGRRAATRMGRYLRDEGIVPDLVLCSSARRARQTLELLSLGPRVDVSIEEELYGAGAEAMLARLRRIGDAVSSVLLVGHNPGTQELALALTDEDPRVVSFPTAALADLRLRSDTWADLGPGGATLHAFVMPRQLD